MTIWWVPPWLINHGLAKSGVDIIRYPSNRFYHQWNIHGSNRNIHWIHWSSRHKTSELSYLDGNPGLSLEMGKNHSLLDGLEDGFFHKWMRTRGTRPGKPLHNYGQSPSFMGSHQLFLWPCSIGKSTINHHFQWLNPLFLWPFSMSQTVCLPGWVPPKSGNLQMFLSDQGGF